MGKEAELHVKCRCGTWKYVPSPAGEHFFHGKNIRFCCAGYPSHLLTVPAHSLHLPVITGVGFHIQCERRNRSECNLMQVWFSEHLNFSENRENTDQKLFDLYKRKHLQLHSTCAGCLSQWTHLFPTPCSQCALCLSSSDLSFFFWLELCLRQHFT